MADTPPPAPAPPPAVTDHRLVPRGVLPRRVQTWLMAGLAVGMLVIILVAGQPAPSDRPAPATAAPQAPNPDRVREYQERLRALEAQIARDAQLAMLNPPAMPAAYDDTTVVPEDPVAAERRRREYESLFASNVVLSRRPDDQRPDTGRSATTAPLSSTGGDAPPPSIDDVADAVVRATTRATSLTSGSRSDVQPPLTSDARAPEPERTGPIRASDARHRLLEGTIIDTVLTNRLDGSAAAPVNCLVTSPVYSHSGQHVVIPAGARVLGQTKPVQTLGETRLAVSFHRLLMPDGRTYPLGHFLGLNQIGDSGLRDRVNHHYWSTFGSAAAVGLISGLAQLLGTSGLGGDGDRTVVIAGGATDATAQASLQVMNRFLNRLPTVTIREGHRVRVYLTADLELPAYEMPARVGRF